MPLLIHTEQQFESMQPTLLRSIRPDDAALTRHPFPMAQQFVSRLVTLGARMDPHTHGTPKARAPSRLATTRPQPLLAAAPSQPPTAPSQPYSSTPLSPQNRLKCVFTK